MEYLVFYGLFMFWFVAMVASVPGLASSNQKTMGEVKQGRFGIVSAAKPDLRKAA
jgi:hypothetical protein